MKIKELIKILTDFQEQYGSDIEVEMLYEDYGYDGGIDEITSVEETYDPDTMEVASICIMHSIDESLEEDD